MIETLFRASIALQNPDSSIRLSKYFTKGITHPESIPCLCDPTLMNSNQDRQGLQPQTPGSPDKLGEEVSAEQIHEAIGELAAARKT